MGNKASTAKMRQSNFITMDEASAGSIDELKKDTLSKEITNISLTKDEIKHQLRLKIPTLNSTKLQLQYLIQLETERQEQESYRTQLSRLLLTDLNTIGTFDDYSSILNQKLALQSLYGLYCIEAYKNLSGVALVTGYQDNFASSTFNSICPLLSSPMFFLYMGKMMNNRGVTFKSITHKDIVNIITLLSECRVHDRVGVDEDISTNTPSAATTPYGSPKGSRASTPRSTSTIESKEYMSSPVHMMHKIYCIHCFDPEIVGYKVSNAACKLYHEYSPRQIIIQEVKEYIPKTKYNINSFDLAELLSKNVYDYNLVSISSLYSDLKTYEMKS